MPTLGQIRKDIELMKATGAAPLYGGDPHLVYPLTPERAMYNEIINKYAGADNDLSILPGDIRSEAVLPTGAAINSFKFLVRQDQPNPTNAIRTTEIRLETRDSFMCDRVTVMFGIEANPLVLSPGRTVLQQWPNPATQALGGFETDSPGIQMAYMGQLSAIVNSVQFLTKMNMLRFQYADQMQRGTLTFTASNTAYNTFAGDRGFTMFTPSMDIHGSDTTSFTVTLPDPFNFGTLASFQIVAVLILRGFYIQGGADYLKSLK